DARNVCLRHLEYLSDVGLGELALFANLGERERVLHCLSSCLDGRCALRITADLLAQILVCLGHIRHSFLSLVLLMSARCSSYRSSALGTIWSYQRFQEPRLSPPIRRMATLFGSNANKILIVEVGRSSFMCWCRDCRTTSASGRPSAGPRSSRISTAASIDSCSSSVRSLHHASNSSVYSTSHAITTLRLYNSGIMSKPD